MSEPELQIPSDSDLAEQVRRGDAAAFDILVARHMRRAFSIAYRLLGHREDAEDLVQDAFLAALQRIDTFQSGRSFGPWLARIVVNRGLNARKARTLRQTEAIPDDVPALSTLPDRAAEQAEIRARCRAALNALPEQQRVITELFELEGFTSAEIAEVLEIPAGTVRWQLHEARRALRGALELYANKQP